MKVLLITSVYKDEVVGPARFARLLRESQTIDVDILTQDTEEVEGVLSVNPTYKWWQRKMKIYFSQPYYSQKIIEIQDQYSHLLFNSSVLANPDRIQRPFTIMINDEKLASLQPMFNFDFIRRYFLRKREKKAAVKAEKVIVNSKYMKSRIETMYGIPGEKVHVLYKGIDLADKVHLFKDNLAPDKSIKVLFVKNDFILGGLTDVIKALSSLSQYNFELTIVGTSYEVKKYCVQRSNITYVIRGLQPNEEVIRAMYESDLFCLPSRKEPLGVAVMEALAVGIPTITTAAGGLPEITDNGQLVWECAPSDPKSLSNQINLCITHPNQRKDKSIAGKNHIRSKFDFNQVCSRLTQILN